MPTDEDAASGESGGFALPSRPLQRDAVDDPPSCGVTRAVADSLETDPFDLPPLNDVVDPEALDELVETRRWQDDDWSTITFYYADHVVAVTGTDEITVSRGELATVRDWPHVSPVEADNDRSADRLETRVICALVSRSRYNRSRVREAIDDVIDRSALARLNATRSNDVPRTGGTVRFSVLGYDVVLEPDGTIAIGSTLQRLKLTGSNVLVVGAVPDAISDRASAQLLGEGDGERHRVVALLDRGVDTAIARLSRAGRAVDPADVIEYGTPARSAVGSRLAGRDFDTDEVAGPSADVPSGPDFDSERSPAPNVETVDGTLEEFLAAVETALDGDQGRHELRLCVDSLRPLLETAGVERSRSLLEPICRRVSDRAGIGHYVLPIERESEYVGAIEPLFDATVELRIDGTEPVQRWHLHASDHVTDWFAL